MGRVAVSRMVTQRGTFVRASVSRLTICARALMRRVPYLYQRSLCRGRSRDSRGRGLTGSFGCTSSRASLLACRRLRGASGVCLDHCRKSVEAFCAEDPIPRLSDSLTCRQASCTHVSVFGGWERAGAAAPTPSVAPLGCFVQTVAARSEHAGEEVGDSTFPLLPQRSYYLSVGFGFAFKTRKLSLHSCVFSHSLSVHVCPPCLFVWAICLP